MYSWVAIYKHDPSLVIESDNYKIYFNSSILTNFTIRPDRPDIVIEDKTTQILDIAIPFVHNITKNNRKSLEDIPETSASILGTFNITRNVLNSEK